MGEPIRASPPIQIEPKPSHAQPRKYISFHAQSILIWSLATCSERHECADRPEESGQRVLSPPTRTHQVAFTAARSVVDDSYGSNVRCPTPRLQGGSLRGGPGDSATSTRLCGVPPWYDDVLTAAPHSQHTGNEVLRSSRLEDATHGWGGARNARRAPAAEPRFAGAGAITARPTVTAEPGGASAPAAALVWASTGVPRGRG